MDRLMRISLTSFPSFFCSLPMAAVTIALVLLQPANAMAQGMYEQGSKKLTVIAGAGNAFDDDYFILGAGAGYYIIDGLELGLTWEKWFSGDPEFDQVTPELTYVFINSSRVDPYVGVLYRRLFIDGLDDLSGIGARAGVNIEINPRTYLGVGAIYVDYISCDEATYVDCSESYPELTLNFIF